MHTMWCKVHPKGYCKEVSNTDAMLEAQLTRNQAHGGWVFEAPRYESAPRWTELTQGQAQIDF